jgi:hypothetical protein
LDGNCEVDFNDLEIFAAQWLDPPGGCSDSNCANFDGINGVDMFDFAMLAGNWRKKICPIVVNECMASNDETIADPQDEYNDWIEFYNASGIAVDMGGMWLADSANWWQIPDDRPAETTVDAGGYLLIWADDDVGDTPGLHASFKLSKSGDEVSLYAADAVTLIDSIEFKTQVSDLPPPPPERKMSVRTLVRLPTRNSATTAAFTSRRSLYPLPAIRRTPI